MKIFGSTKRIAVQVEMLEPAGDHIVGKICLWADGIKIGDDQQPVLLRPIGDFFRGTLREPTRQLDPVMTALSPEQVLEEVEAVLFNDEVRRKREDYRAFCICPNGCEAFDGERAFLVQREEGKSFIWRAFSDRRVRELRLASGEYETAVRSFLAWLDPLTGYDPLSDHFAGKSFVILGQFSKPKSEIEESIRRLGGRIDYTVTADTSYVVAGNLMRTLPPRVLQARELNVPVLSEAEFNDLVR